VLRPSLVILLASGCVFTNPSPLELTEPDLRGQPLDGGGLGPELETAPDASPRLDDGEFGNLAARIDGYFDDFGSKRLHIQLDRPMYRPG